MSIEDKGLSRSQLLAAKVVFATFQILKDAGGQLPSREVLSQIPQRIKLDEWESQIYEKTGYIRWQSILHFYSINCMKANFLIKQKGMWILTKEGEAAIVLGEFGLLKAIRTAYREWHAAKVTALSVNQEDEHEIKSEKASSLIDLEQMDLKAAEGIRQYINTLSGYEFQDLVAALLRGMGYHTPFVAERGKDGGLDIIAYRDPLGTSSPRIKVQVKHRPNNSSSSDMVRQLMGLLQKDGDIGLFVSSGGYTPDAKTTARNSHAHVELIDIDRFINLWQEFYPKLSDEDKALLPLRAVYFISLNE